MDVRGTPAWPPLPHFDPEAYLTEPAARYDAWSLAEACWRYNDALPDDHPARRRGGAAWSAWRAWTERHRPDLEEEEILWGVDGVRRRDEHPITARPKAAPVSLANA